jgi:hypothetical protein
MMVVVVGELLEVLNISFLFILLKIVSSLWTTKKTGTEDRETRSGEKAVCVLCVCVNVKSTVFPAFLSILIYSLALVLSYYMTEDFGVLVVVMLLVGYENELLGISFCSAACYTRFGTGRC